MYKISTLILISFVLSFCSCTRPIDCGKLSTNDCREKFSKDYGESFKEIHQTAINDLYNLFKTATNKIIDDLAADDKLRGNLQEMQKSLEEDMKEFNANKDDPKKVAEILRHMTATARGDKDEMEDDRYKAIAEKYETKDLLANRYFKMINDMAKAYTDMYEGLRESDLEEYPGYEHVNRSLKEVQTDKDNKLKIEDYFRFKDWISELFDLDYMKAVKEVV